MLKAAQTRASHALNALKSAGAYVSQKLKSSSVPSYRPASLANDTTSFAHIQFSVSAKGILSMRDWFAWAEI